jgi:methylated-DNA-protein-cysteine methyltransferase-like protein
VTKAELTRNSELGTRNFREAVWALAREIPPGRVTTYGWLARRLGRPQHARLVGYAMHSAPDDVPCQRVINSQGKLSGAPHFGPPGQQAMLEAEGVVFKRDGGVDLRRYLWRPEQPADADPPEAAAGAESLTADRRRR